jgi:hypothetical protein
MTNNTSAYRHKPCVVGLDEVPGIRRVKVGSGSELSLWLGPSAVSCTSQLYYLHSPNRLPAQAHVCSNAFVQASITTPATPQQHTLQMARRGTGFTRRGTTSPQRASTNKTDTTKSGGVIAKTFSPRQVCSLGLDNASHNLRDVLNHHTTHTSRSLLDAW